MVNASRQNSHQTEVKGSDSRASLSLRLVVGMEREEDEV